MRWRAEPKTEASLKTHRGTATAGGLTSQSREKELEDKHSSEARVIATQQTHLAQINIRHIPSRGQLHCVPLQRQALVAIVANSPAHQPTCVRDVIALESRSDRGRSLDVPCGTLM